MFDYIESYCNRTRRHSALNWDSLTTYEGRPRSQTISAWILTTQRNETQDGSGDRAPGQALLATLAAPDPIFNLAHSADKH